MLLSKYFWILILIFLSINTLLGNKLNSEDSCKIFFIDPIQELTITGNTGEKPQSKVWFHDKIWWAVLSNINGTELWQLIDKRWVSVLHLSDSTNIKADTRVIGNVTHILLFQGQESELVSVEYDSKDKRYQLWSKRTDKVKIQLERVSETATIDVDLLGRMWLASDDETEIHVRWSDPPYDVWSNPQTLATGISSDDISAITSFPDGSIGVLWSNQKTKRFGFRMHSLNAGPENWSVDEIPASSSAIALRNGMADDHLNIAMASDGTLYAAVKTSYDTNNYPLIALLVRRPSGRWDRLYKVDDEGSRGIVLLNEEKNCLIIVYTSYRDHQIVCKSSETSIISFSKRRILINGINNNKSINNVTSTKQNITNEVVLLASESGIAKSVLIKYFK